MSRLQEVSILKSLNYDRNITQFYGACIRPGQDLMLVTEVRADVPTCATPMFATGLFPSLAVLGQLVASHSAQTLFCLQAAHFTH